MQNSLPVAVILPILNCADKLGEHLARLEELLASVEEVVVVDSHSSDGSFSLAKERILHPRTKFLSFPPGLYAAWNSGVATAKSRYVYISTIGDWITLGGLEHLVSVAESFSADVVISPPRCVESDRKKSGHRQFPIHQILADSNLSTPLLLPDWLAFTLSTGFSIESLLGSSASNLYGTRFLQDHPFPTNFGKAGDSAWFRRIALRCQIAITPQTVADFLLDQDHGSKEHGEISDLLARLNLISEEAFKNWSQSHPEDADVLNMFLGWRKAAGNSPEQTLDAIRHLEGIANTNHEQRSYIIELQHEIEKMRNVMQTLDATCSAQRIALEQGKNVSGMNLICQGLCKLIQRR
jgi:glycosyltransferase involved in cell wall biosynthesis